MPPSIRSTSSTDRPFDVAAACSLTACLSSAFSFAPGEVGGIEHAAVSVGAFSFAGRRYRCDEDIVQVVAVVVVVVVMMGCRACAGRVLMGDVEVDRTSSTAFNYTV